MSTSPPPSPTGGIRWHLTLHRPNDDYSPETRGQEGSFLETLQEHFAWLQERHRDGRVVFSGANLEIGLGVIVYARLSTAEVEADVATEPMLAAGIRKVEVLPFDLHQALGVGTFSLPGPPG